MSASSESTPRASVRPEAAADDDRSPSGPPRPLAGRRDGLLAALVLGAVLLAGQWGRGLVTMDDLREAEVALEMHLGGDYIVPHLAGLPFVEKPPGFPALVALAHGAGGASLPGAGRAVSILFAAVALLATYRLGERARGPRVGLMAASLLGLSPLFCRVSHEILLDNALLAAVAFAQLFLWESVHDPTPKGRRAASWAAGLAIGFSFLVKGFVGPALVGSGLLLLAAIERSWRGLGRWIRPGLVAGFFLAALTWFVPFALTAGPELLRVFVVDNHLSRFTHAYEGHARPFYYYLLTLPYRLGWATFLLVPAAAAAVRGKGGPVGRFFLAAAVGPILLLSASRGKEAIYLLPVYPALALVGASWLERALEEPGNSGRVLVRILFGGAAIGALGAAIFAASLAWPGAAAPVGVGIAGAAALVAIGVFLLRREPRPGWGELRVSQVLWGLGCLLFVWGPVADREDANQEWRPVVRHLLAEAGAGEIVLCWPTDELRGALGVYRGRPPREVRSCREVVQRLTRSPGSIAVVYPNFAGEIGELGREEPGKGLSIAESLRLPYHGKTLVVLRAVPTSSLED